MTGSDVSGLATLDGEQRRAAIRVALGLGDDPWACPDPRRIYDVDPLLLTLGPNVRTDMRPDLEFTASLKEHGVLQAITCYLAQGELVVLMGARRTFFSAAAGLATVKVCVLPEPPGDIEATVDQVVENDKRANLTAAERADAVAQLAAFGVPVAQIGRRLSMRRGDVDDALAVAASRTALDATSAHGLTLEQGAAIAAVDDDPQAVAELTAAADPSIGGWDHAVARVADQRRDAAERDAVAARLRGAGIRVLDERPAWDAPARYLVDLRLSPEEHAACRGHAALLVQRERPVDGHRQLVWVTDWLCTDPFAFGHGARQATLEEERRTADRAERERVGREWRTAQTVRRRWLGQLATRATPPAGAERWILLTLLGCEPAVTAVMTREDRHRTLRGVLGLDHLDPGPGIAELLARGSRPSAPRATVLTLVLLLAAVDDRLGRLGMEQGAEFGRGYLAQLVAWGYEAAPVERRFLGDDAQDGVHDVAGANDG